MSLYNLIFLQPIEREINYEEVVVTEVTPEGHFYVQKVSDGPKAEELLSKLRQEFQANPPLPGAYNPKRGDTCAAKFTLDDEWYRAKIEKVQGGKMLLLILFNVKYYMNLWIRE